MYIYECGDMFCEKILGVQLDLQTCIAPLPTIVIGKLICGKDAQRFFA